ncbi:8964_t:CDS:1, partial [Rhizophagus irregularis]
DVFRDPFNLFKATLICLGSSFIQLKSSCIVYSALPSIHIAEYTFENPPTPICFTS